MQIVVTSQPTQILISINGRRAYRAPSFDVMAFRRQYKGIPLTIIINGKLEDYGL